MQAAFRRGPCLLFSESNPQPDGTYREDFQQQYPLRFFVHGRLFGVDPPGVVFLLGSDGYGRDVFSRVLYGAQVSLLTGLLAAAISLGIGWTLGTIAGFFGGWTDQLLMRASEFFMALPGSTCFSPCARCCPYISGPVQSFLLLIGIIGGVGWVRPARLIRGVVLSARERGYRSGRARLRRGSRYT